MPKPKIALYWCASCGGCEETVVDLAEDILGVVEKVDIVLWPVAMDFKYKDIEAMPDKSIVATLTPLGPLGIPQKFDQWDQEMEHFAQHVAAKDAAAGGACADHGTQPQNVETSHA